MENTANTLNRKHKFDSPDAYIVVFCVVIMAAIMTFIIPAGYFDVNEETYINSSGSEAVRTVVDPDSFQYLTDENGDPMTIPTAIFSDYYATEKTGVLNALYNGFTAGGMDGIPGMIAFIFIIGGSFSILTRTGAISRGIMAILRILKGKDIIIIPILSILFSLGGAVLGLIEEFVPFAIILIPIFCRLGYDSITGLLTVYISTIVGWAFAWMNPFSILVAQGLADVPAMSGSGFRIVFWTIAMIVLIVYTVLRARKIKINPELSVAYESDNKWFRRDTENEDALNEGKLSFGHVLVLFTLLATIVWLMWGVLTKGWYFGQLSAVFLAGGIVGGILGVAFKMDGMRINTIADAFKEGVVSMAPVAIIIAMGKGITLVLGGATCDVPSVLNTILHFSGETFGALPAVLCGAGMFIFQWLFNFLVSAATAQAAIVMPIMAPLSDVLDVSRQTACLAYQMGDAFNNLVNPTSPTLMMYLGVAHLNFVTWVKYHWKLQAVFFGLCLVAVVISVYCWA